MHRLLVDPIEGRGMLGKSKRLIVVPHSSLSYLPFATVRNERSGRYLAQSYTILTLPSASALIALRDANGTSADRDDLSGVVFAQFTNTLQATRTDAEAIRRIVGGARTLLDDAASERAFREAAKTNRVLHLATHGTLNVENPMFSRIELARGRGADVSGSADDGHLAVHEIIGMRTLAPLVFLSGCETALGSAWSTDFARGEEYASLSQALLYAGARNAVSTLWRIDDESAGVFAGHFYRNLTRMPPAEALAAAQQNMLIDRRYSEPYHWAAYQLAGSGDRISLEQRWWGLFAR
jgi:CHAT domain-containing protein